MSCDRLTHVHRYHDGELPQAESADLEAHLAECAECRGLLSDLQHLSIMIASASRTALPNDALLRLRDTLRRARERSVIRVAGWLTAAAAAVLVFAALNGPADRNETVAQQPGVWQTVAATPPMEARESSSDDLVVMAQWMADELSPHEQR